MVASPSSARVHKGLRAHNNKKSIDRVSNSVPPSKKPWPFPFHHDTLHVLCESQDATLRPRWRRLNDAAGPALLYMDGLRRHPARRVHSQARSQPATWSHRPSPPPVQAASVQSTSDLRGRLAQSDELRDEPRQLHGSSQARVPLDAHGACAVATVGSSDEHERDHRGSTRCRARRSSSFHMCALAF